MKYNFYGWETATIKPINNTYLSIHSPRDLYDALSEIWCAETCAPRLRDKWTADNKNAWTMLHNSISCTGYFRRKVYGILRDGGNYH